MEKTKKWLNEVRKYVRKNWFIFFAIATYIFFTAYYMGPSVWNCTTTVYGFGDNTAGPIWRSSLPEEQGLLGSYTSMTNAPYGDDLYSPVGYSLILQPVLIGALTEVAGPICGYNLVNIIGFLASALLMFGFIYALTRHRWVALLAGYAVAFTPYYQMKVGGHPSYGYQAMFIALIWLFYRLIQLRRKRDAAYLAIAYAVAVYFDPYFMLYATLVVTGLFAAWLLLNWRVFTLAFWKNNKNVFIIRTKMVLRRIGLSAAIVAMLLVPLVFILLTKGQQINESVSASRGNVLFEAKACSNWPHEYLVPFILHPGFERIFGDDRYHTINEEIRGGLSCGIGEDSVGLSLTLIALVSIVGIVLLWEKLNKRKLNLSKELTYPALAVISGVVAVGVLGFIISLPPVQFHGIPTPTHELLSITYTWRTLTRGYMLVNIALVILSSLMLVYLLRHFAKNKQILGALLAVVFLGVLFEYQAFAPFAGNKLSTFSYRKDVPSVYTWLRDQASVTTIAEYPMERSGGESDAGSYYLTMQVIHKKKLFNSALSYSRHEEFRDALKNIADPQTLPVLRAYGVEYVIVHGVEKTKLEEAIVGTNARIAYGAPQSQFNLLSHTPTVKNDVINVIDIRKVEPRTVYIDLGKGFARNATIINSVIDWQYEAVSGSKLQPVMIGRGKEISVSEDENKLCFSAKMSVPEEATTLKAMTSRGAIELGSITGHQMNRYKLTAQGAVTLETGNNHNLRVTEVGCETNE